MSDDVWGPIVGSLAQVRSLLDAAAQSSHADDAGPLSVCGELASTLLRLSEQAQSAARIVPPELLVRCSRIHTTVVDALRMAADERKTSWARVRDELLSATADVAGSQALAAASHTLAKPKATVRSLQPADLKHFAEDSRSQSRTMWYYGFGALLLAAVLGFACVWMVVYGLPPSAPAILVFATLALAGALALASGQQARECRRGALDTRRTRRQLSILDKYLEPLPPLGQDLLRAVLAQRLFPRLIDDDNPMREDEMFPEEEALMLALSPELRAERLKRETLDATQAGD